MTPDEIAAELTKLTRDPPHLMRSVSAAGKLFVWCNARPSTAEEAAGIVWAVFDPYLSRCERCLRTWEGAKVQADARPSATEQGRPSCELSVKR